MKNKNVNKNRCLQNHLGPIKILIKQYRTWQCGQRLTETLIPSFNQCKTLPILKIMR